MTVKPEKNIVKATNPPKIKAKFKKLLTPIVIAILLMIIGISVYIFMIQRISRSNTSDNEAIDSNSLPQPTQVTALGRLEPAGEVIQVSVATSITNNSGARIAKLLVNQGDLVRENQVIAILDIHDRYAAALEKAQQQVKVAQAKLAQVTAGAKPGEINAQRSTVERLKAQLQEQVAAQQATIKRLEAEVQNAQIEYQRYQLLQQSGAVSTSLFDSKRLALETAQAQLNEAEANFNETVATLTKQIDAAEATLDAITQVRPVDIKTAQAEVDSAIASVKQAKAELALTYVRSPIDGQVLKIHARPGESVSQQGIAELGQTDNMYVVAEVYQTDINQIRLGQEATVTGDAFTGYLKGTVAQIGLQVGKKDIFGTDPTAEQDARVVEVKIRLNSEDRNKVAGLTNLQTKVSIDTRRIKSTTRILN